MRSDRFVTYLSLLQWALTRRQKDEMFAKQVNHVLLDEIFH
jgi:hypothetical protein